MSSVYFKVGPLLGPCEYKSESPVAVSFILSFVFWLLPVSISISCLRVVWSWSGSSLESAFGQFGLGQEAV